MNCEQARTMLSDYVMEEVSTVERLEIRQHADGCATCAEELERLQQTMTLLARAEVPEEVPRRIRLVAEPVSAWTAFWRSGARLAFAGSGLACLAVGLLAVSQAHITVGAGSWEIAFGAAADSRNEVPTPPVTAAAVQTDGLGREEIVRLVEEAVRASETRQQLTVTSLVQAVTEQAEQQRLQDMEELSESFRYIQAAQTMMWKDQVQSQEVMGALARQVGLPAAQP